MGFPVLNGLEVDMVAEGKVGSDDDDDDDDVDFIWLDDELVEGINNQTGFFLVLFRSNCPDGGR